MSKASIQSLPTELRLQILAQLPLASLLNMQGMSRDLYNDIDHLFHTRSYVLGVLQRLHAKVMDDHKVALLRYLDSSRKACDDLIHDMFVLVRLMNFVVQIKSAVEACTSDVRRVCTTGDGLDDCDISLTPSRALVGNIVLHCRSAASQITYETADLWTLELKKLLYPPVGFQYLAV